MTQNYNTILRDLLTVENIKKEITKLDLFNHPYDFKKITEQIADEYRIYIQVYDNVPRGTEYWINDEHGHAVVCSRYFYGNHNEACFEALHDFVEILTKDILNHEHKFHYTPITAERIKEFIYNHENKYWRLPAYLDPRG